MCALRCEIIITVKRAIMYIYEKGIQDGLLIIPEGLSADVLVTTPSDPEILRLSSSLSYKELRQLVIHLGITYQQCEDIYDNYPRDIAMVKFLILIKWRNSMNGTYKDLMDKFGIIGYTSHVLCKVRRIKRKNSDIPEVYLDSVPTDEILDALVPEIGIVSFQLGIELGRSVPELEAIQYNFTGDLLTQTRQILYNWRNDTSLKPTLGILQQALVNIDRGTKCLKSIVDELGVKKHHFSKQPIEKSAPLKMRTRTHISTNPLKPAGILNKETGYKNVAFVQKQHFSKQPVELPNLSNVSTQRSLSSNPPKSKHSKQTDSVSVEALRRKFETM